MARHIKVAVAAFPPALRQAPRERILADVGRLFDELRGRGLDLVVTCESIGIFAQTAAQAETPEAPGALFSLYRDFSASQDCFVVGAGKISEGGRVYNGAALYAPGGTLAGAYRKRYLIRSERDAGLSSGDGPVVLDTAIGRLGFAICFDLNFDDLRQAYARLSPDLLVFPSLFNGGLLQQLWAHDCRAYFLAATEYPPSGILDPLGGRVLASHEYDPCPVATINLDYAILHLDHNREKFAGIRQRYADGVEIRIPPGLGRAMLICHDPSTTAMDIVRDFELEPLDAYLRRMGAPAPEC